jgi:hypothetical protein
VLAHLEDEPAPPVMRTGGGNGAAERELEHTGTREYDNGRVDGWGGDG